MGRIRHRGRVLGGVALGGEISDLLGGEAGSALGGILGGSRGMLGNTVAGRNTVRGGRHGLGADGARETVAVPRSVSRDRGV